MIILNNMKIEAILKNVKNYKTNFDSIYKDSF